PQAHAEPPRSFEGTLALSSEAIEEAMRAAKPLPFIAGAEPALAAARPHPSPRAAPLDFGGTLDLTEAPARAQHAPAWLGPKGAPAAGDAFSLTLTLPGRVAIADQKPVDETVQIVPQAPGAVSREPFPIAPAGMTRPGTAEGTPWAVAPLSPAPQPAFSF